MSNDPTYREWRNEIETSRGRISGINGPRVLCSRRHVCHAPRKYFFHRGAEKPLRPMCLWKELPWNSERSVARVMLTRALRIELVRSIVPRCDFWAFVRFFWTYPCSIHDPSALRWKFPSHFQCTSRGKSYYRWGRKVFLRKKKGAPFISTDHGRDGVSRFEIGINIGLDLGLGSLEELFGPSGRQRG